MNNRCFRLVFLAALAVAVPAHACINGRATNQQGESVHPMNGSGYHLLSHLSTPTSKEHLIAPTRAIVAAVQKDPSFDNLNDLAAILIRHGRLPQAVRLLEFQERRYPGRYQTASNLGTAYELMGRNDEALTWISKGLKRNPGDHFGTEWLHVRILQAKLGPGVPSAPGRSILDLDFGNDAMPRRPAHLPVDKSGKPMSLLVVAQALRYQLFERISLVPAPDPLVAGLLLDWANLELMAGVVESADVLYDAALRYGSTERQTIALRKTQVEKSLARRWNATKPKEGSCELCAPAPQSAAMDKSS